MKKIGCLIVAMVTLNVAAQLRIVNGQIYRSDDPRVWRVFPDLEVVQIFPDGCLKVCEVQYDTAVDSDNGLRAGTFGTTTHGTKTYGETFLLENYASRIALAPGMDIGYVRAMLVPPLTVTTGERQVSGQGYAHSGPDGASVSASATVESHEYDAVTYDCGIPYSRPLPVLTPAQLAARHALAESNIVRFVESQATNGDIISQCELGERYMSGRGVAKDAITGQMWLRKAALGGSIEASNYLDNLTVTNSVAVTH